MRWLRSRGYATVSLDEDGWHEGGRECITQALMLASRLQKSGGDTFELLESRVFEAVDVAENEAGFLFPVLADLVISFGMKAGYSTDLAGRLANAAATHIEQGAIELARHCYASAKNAYAQAKNRCLSHTGHPSIWCQTSYGFLLLEHSQNHSL